MSMSEECWNVDGALGEAPLSSERYALVLYSLHAVTKKTSTVPRGFGRTSPHPGPLESSARRVFYRLVSCTLEFRKAILLILRSLFPYTQGAKTAPLKL
jgi:hypothetical protein